MSDMDNASLVDAFLDGQDAGRLMHGPSLNPFQEGSEHYDAWERGRQGAYNVQLAGMVA